MSIDAAAGRAWLIDHAGVQISIDGHLFTRHGVKGKPSRNFSDTGGAFGNDYKVNDDQDQEDNDAYRIVPTDDELTKRLDYCPAGSFQSFPSMQKYEAGGGHPQGQAEKSRDQEEEGKVKNSMGLMVYKDRRSTIKEKVRLKLKNRSRRRLGRGNIITKRMIITPRATESLSLIDAEALQEGGGGRRSYRSHRAPPAAASASIRRKRLRANSPVFHPGNSSFPGQGHDLQGYKAPAFGHHLRSDH